MLIPLLFLITVHGASAQSEPIDKGDPPPAGQQKGQQKGPKDGKQGKKGKKGKKQQDPHWETEPFVKPEAGAQINTNGAGASAFVTVGASAGVRYAQVGAPPPSWSGQTRVRGLYGTGNGVDSLDARVGSFIGPRWKQLGLQFGPDLFWNRLTTSAGESLAPSVGLEFPVTATARISKELSLSAGVSPAWLADESRSVDWSQVAVPGFGDEFSYMAGVNLNLNPLHLSVNYIYKIVATGAQQNVGVGVNFGL